MSNAHCTECSECNLILPDAILENITHLTSMLYLPQRGQVGRVNSGYDTVAHRFHHGQPQHDWILEIARSTLADLAQKHLSVHAHQIQITSVNDAPPLYPPGQNHLGCKAYNFEDGRYFGRGNMATIKVLPQEEFPTAQKIHVYDSQATPRWTSLKNWLLTTFKKDDEMMGIHLYDLQGAWWASFPAGCPLLRLPRELRDQIYSYIIPVEDAALSINENIGACLEKDECVSK